MTLSNVNCYDAHSSGHFPFPPSVCFQHCGAAQCVSRTVPYLPRSAVFALGFLKAVPRLFRTTSKWFGLKGAQSSLSRYFMIKLWGIWSGLRFDHDAAFIHARFLAVLSPLDTLDSLQPQWEGEFVCCLHGAERCRCYRVRLTMDLPPNDSVFLKCSLLVLCVPYTDNHV